MPSKNTRHQKLNSRGGGMNSLGDKSVHTAPPS